MTKNTKRVDELEVGDIVIFPGCKGMDTISRIEKRSDWIYEVFSEGIRNSSLYDVDVEVTYLGNNKKEGETMRIQKVDCSALYPYFDALANEETTLQYINIPVYVRQQLKNIHELFEGVLGFTLEEVKTLYFERKMSKQEPEVQNVSDLESKPKTKKAKYLCIGDKIIIPEVGEVRITKLNEPPCEFYDSVIRVEWKVEGLNRFDFLNIEREFTVLD